MRVGFHFSPAFFVLLIAHFTNAASLQQLIKPQVTAPTPAAESSPVSATPLQNLDVPQKTVVPPTNGDDQKTQKILNSLIKQAGWFPKVKITVIEGMVTIKGITKNAQQLEWLAKTADRLPGVVAVINQTEIEVPPVTDLTPAYDEFRRLIEEAKRALPLIAIALLATVIFIFSGKYISRFTRSQWQKHISNPFLLNTVSRLTMFPVWAIFFYIVLKTAGLSSLATTIIGGTGAASLVLGFAFKGIAENYLSGLLLAIRSPFTKGDEIQVEQYSGFVQSLNMRGTTIVDYDGNIVLIPNSIVIQSVVRNKTTNSRTRAAFSITISYTDSIAKAQELVNNALKSIPDILPKPAAGVNVDKLTESGIVLAISFWFDTTKSSGDRIKSVLADRIKDDLLRNGLHIPDTAREVVFTDSLRVQLTKEKDVEVPKTAKLPDPRPEQTGKEVGKDEDSSDIRDMAEDVDILKKTIHTGLLRSGS